jgi:hypothetical protein
MSRTSAIAPAHTLSFSLQLAPDAMSVASVSSAALPRMFYEGQSTDPVLMQLSFLEEFELRHHQEFLRRLEEVRRVQLAQLSQPDSSGSRSKSHR